MDQTKDFIEIVSEEGKVLFVNLSQVLLVDEITDTHCRLQFSSDAVVNINGKRAPLVVEIIKKRSISIPETLPQ